jgi:hypothetical protein
MVKTEGIYLQIMDLPTGNFTKISWCPAIDLRLLRTLFLLAEYGIFATNLPVFKSSTQSSTTPSVFALYWISIPLAYFFGYPNPRLKSLASHHSQRY